MNISLYPNSSSSVSFIQKFILLAVVEFVRFHAPRGRRVNSKDRQIGKFEDGFEFI